MAVLDVVAEGIETDFLCLEFYLRRAPQPAGVVDDADHLERRRLVGAEFPHAQGFKRRDGTAEQGGGAVVGYGRALACQHGLDAAGGKRDGGSEPRRAVAYHDRADVFVRHQKARS